MSQVNLKVQVHCLRPSWVDFENNKYRLYVDNDMITERSWIWNTKTLLDENIWVKLELDTEHSIKIVPVLDPINSFVKFTLKNLRINNNLYYTENEEQLELSFRL
jgi:hypothetical protein